MWTEDEYIYLKNISSKLITLISVVCLSILFREFLSWLVKCSDIIFYCKRNNQLLKNLEMKMQSLENKISVLVN